MDGQEIRNTMKARAMTDARDSELVRSFLIDLEHEYSTAHRIAFQAQWGLGARPRPARELAFELGMSRSAAERMVEDGLMYARKWFGADDELAARSVPLVRAA